MPENLLNIRMHASRHGKHLSGAERLVEQCTAVESEVSAMLRRALEHPRGQADRISLLVEEIPLDHARSGRLLDLSGYHVDHWQTGQTLACQLLVQAGVSEPAARSALATLKAGAAPDGSSMRGAMLVDACSGERLEPDRARGVRVSRMDLTISMRQQLRGILAELDLDNQHVIEALTLASKVQSAPGIVAELCWSDDPDYTTGYVASAAGYQRIAPLKPVGEERGGRAFFVCRDRIALPQLVAYLERTPYLIDQPGTASRMVPWPDNE